MPVGTHNDAFKAHQLVKRLAGTLPQPELAKMASGILLDFVKSQRQTCSGEPPPTLPEDPSAYDAGKLDSAIFAVAGLCGQCEESHVDSCFVNQARRALIAAKTGVDLGAKFDGRKKIDELLSIASELAKSRKAAAEAKPATSLPTSANALSGSLAGLEADKEIAKLKAEIEALREKEVFRATLTDEIVSTIKAVSNGNFAAEMPVHDDEQLGKLASAFNMMLKTVKGTMADLDKLVGQRSGELRLIMDMTPSGILSFDPAGRINKERSRSAERILGAGELPGKDFLDAIGLTRRREEDRKRLQEFFDVMRMELLPEADMAGLNPFPELQLAQREGAKPRWVKLDYHLMQHGQGLASHILVTVEDIGKEKEMEAEAAEAHSESSFLRALAEDPELFREFLDEMRKSLAEAAEALELSAAGKGGADKANKVYRGVHTVKGVAASLGIARVVELTGDLESSLGKLRDGGALTQEFVESTRKTLEGLSGERFRMAEAMAKLLGDDAGASSHDMALRVRLSSIKELEAALEAANVGEPGRTQLREAVQALRSTPARLAFARTAKMVPGLAQRLGKDAELSLSGGDIPVDCEAAKELNAALVHIVRNAMDHGVETPEERESAGKCPKAKIKLSAAIVGGQLLVKLSDDGRGIDPLLMKAAAVEKGLIPPEEAAALSDDECVNLIFRPGFSTAKAVSEVSGRGVGMDAALAAVRDGLGGSVKVESALGKGTSVSMRIPLRLR